uniref:H(+)-exporting diphosphatase n=1 Tax=Parascaris equorum TaxID=6256 RepID=A0A914RE35_PAREQ
LLCSFIGKSAITSGLAAGITIGVFFTVFLLTFGCRIYSARMERLERRNSERIASMGAVFELLCSFIGKSAITSGLAAGITIGVFFTVFLLTFGCRI